MIINDEMFESGFVVSMKGRGHTIPHINIT